MSVASGNATVNGNSRNNAKRMDRSGYSVSVDTVVACTRFDVLSYSRSHLERFRAQRASDITRTMHLGQGMLEEM